MYCLMLKTLSRPTVPSTVTLYQCNRGIKFLRNIFKKQFIRVPSEFNYKEYRVFYSFPQVIRFSSQIRLKYLKCGVISATAIPVTYFYSIGEVDIGPLITYFTLAFMYILFTFYLAHAGKNLIGRMYLHKDMKEIIISYINKNGKRMNKSFEVDNIKTTNHPNAMYRKFFKRVIVQKPYTEFNLCTVKTVKVDYLIFNTIFPGVM